MRPAGQNKIYYNYYYSGKEDVCWNLCQPLYLSNHYIFLDSSPIWTVTVNGRDIAYAEMEQSYITMLQHWIDGPDDLWGLEDAEAMTRKALAREVTTT